MSNTKKMVKMETKNTQIVENQSINNTKIKSKKPNTQIRQIFEIPKMDHVIQITYKNTSITNQLFGENQISYWKMCEFITSHDLKCFVENDPRGTNVENVKKHNHHLINQCQIDWIGIMINGKFVAIN